MSCAIANDLRSRRRTSRMSRRVYEVSSIRLFGIFRKPHKSCNAVRATAKQSRSIIIISFSTHDTIRKNLNSDASMIKRFLVIYTIVEHNVPDFCVYFAFVENSFNGSPMMPCRHRGQGISERWNGLWGNGVSCFQETKVDESSTPMIADTLIRILVS